MDRDDDREMAVWEPPDIREELNDAFDFWAYVMLILWIVFLAAAGAGVFG